MPNYVWPPMGERRLMGKRHNRIDGPEKATGRAKYSSDLNPPNLLHGTVLTCPHAHAKVTSIDVSAAKSTPGVTAITVVAPAGTETQWRGAEVAYLSATSEQIALDALKKINVQYEVLPHFVDDEKISEAGPRAKPSGEQVTGDPDQSGAEVTHEGYYGIPVITHCCLEPHGNVVDWKGDKINLYPSTQNVSGIGGDLAKALEVPATQIHVHQDHIGGGFGSKFTADRWGYEAAKLSKESGGRPVKMFLDRPTELTIAGVRPSAYGNIKVGAKRDGTIVLWESKSWASGGFAGGGSPPIPYVFTKIPHQRKNHTAVSINAGPARAWRAPNHQQACYLTCSAMEDLAAKLKMDPLEVFDKNADHTLRPEVYRLQLKQAADLMDWKKKWHPRGDSGRSHLKRGLGLGVHTWQGLGHASQARTTIHPDGTVEIELGSQDLGTGTRTAIAIVAAETFGLPISAIKVKIGDNSFPPSGASGGSTTIGGVSASTRKSTLNILEKLFEAVAPSLGVPPDQLEAVDGRIQVKGNPSKALAWKAACAKLGQRNLSDMGENNPRNPGSLISAGVGGVQMAEVEVDTETGLVRMVKTVAVQDCGTMVNLKTAESQVYGAIIMGVCAALYEERIMDQQIGRVMNPDMEFYKLAGAGDIGEIVIKMNMEKQFDDRGVIGLGEPPAIALITSIGNAVANAIGVRVTNVPLTPERVLAALEKEECLMQAFEYASPATLKEALGLLGNRWGEADALAGGTDILSLLKDEAYATKRLVNIKNIKELGGIRMSGGSLRIGATVTFDELAENAEVRRNFALAAAARGVASPQIRNVGTVGGDLCQRPRCWYFRQGFGLLAKHNGKSLVPDGENKYHAIFGHAGGAYFVSPSSLGPALVALGATIKLASASGTREVTADKFFVVPSSDSAREIALLPNEILTEILVPSGMKSATYEVRQKQSLDWPLATASVAAKMQGSTVSSARVVMGHVAPTPWSAKGADSALAGKTLSDSVIDEAAKAAVAGASPLSQNAYKVQLARVAVKRALMELRGKA